MTMTSTFRNRILPSPCQDRFTSRRTRRNARGQRLDRFLADAIGTLSRSRVKTLIEQGHASRDGAVLTSRPNRSGLAPPIALDLPPPAPPRRSRRPSPSQSSTRTPT